MSRKWEPPHYKRAGAYGHVGVDDEEYEEVSYLIANHGNKARSIRVDDIQCVRIFREDKKFKEEIINYGCVVLTCLSPFLIIISLTVFGSCLK